MKNIKSPFIVLLSFITLTVGAQEVKQQDTKTYKKRVLENTEVSLLMSYYEQEGDNAAVTGGVGNESLKDITPTIVVSIPLNDDDVLTIDFGISDYTSASSSNLDPFDGSGASSGGGEDDDENGYTGVSGSPWIESSGASAHDIWVNLNVGYSHSSDDRNKIWGVNLNFASEYDYISFGLGGNYTYLFNEKNTSLSVKANVFLDQWRPKYPTELDSYAEANQNLSNGFFAGVDILDQNGAIIDKNGTAVWSSLKNTFLTTENRNTYNISLGFSQILSKNAQFSVFLDLTRQDGWLGNPMQRVYFADRANYYIGDPRDIPNYTNTKNNGVFHLADDIERLPDTRTKIPIGARFNYYINEIFVLRSYYRYYFDDWGISSHTASLEVPIKISRTFTLYPSYRYYTQTEADYFAGYNQLLSTDEFYTSDYDLSEFNANQYGFGVRYSNSASNNWFKSADLKYASYQRNSSFKSGIISASLNFVLD